MTRAQLLEVERICKSLGNKRRLIILQLLAARGRVSVSDIAAHLKLSLPSTSRHLRSLVNADLIENEQTSTTVNYFIPKDRDQFLDTALKALR